VSRRAGECIANRHGRVSTVGLQLLLKRYTRARQYAESNSAEAKRLASGWAKAAEFVKALIMSLPPT